MASTEKKKVLTIETGQSVKNVKTLKQQIKEIKNQMALLEKGTVEYEKASKKLADLNQKQIEINEAMKYSNKDIGATLNNLKNVATGVIAGFNGISASLQLLGIESDESGEALKKIQLTMAVIQSIGAIDTAFKSLKGLKNAFIGVKDSAEDAEKGLDTLNATKKGVGTSTQASASAELTEANALQQNTAEMVKNNEEADKYNERNRQNTQTTEESTAAIYKEIEALGAKKSALEGDLDVAEKVMAGFKKDIERDIKFTDATVKNAKERIIARQQEMVEWAKQNEGVDSNMYNNSVESLRKWEQETNKAKIISMDFAETLSELESCFRSTTDPIGRYGEEIDQLEYRLTDLYTASASLGEDIMPELAQSFNETSEEIKGWFSGSEAFEEVSTSLNSVKGEFEEIDGYQSDFASGISNTEKKINSLKAEIDKETKSVKDNTKATQANTKATKAGATGWKIFGKAGAGAWKAIKTAMIATGIGAIIALVTEGITYLIDLVKGLNLNGLSDDYKMLAEVNDEACKSFQKESAKIEILTDAVHDNRKSYEERKAALDELQKIVPEYHASLTEEGELLNDNTQAIEDYCVALQEKLKYQAYENKYIELLEEQIEKERAITEYETGNWWFKLWHSKKARLKEYNEVLREQEVIWKEIKALDLSLAFSGDKKTGGGVKTVLKSYIEQLKEIKSLLQNIWGTYFDQLDNVINYQMFDPTKAFRVGINRILKTGKDVSGMFTDWFNKAMKDGINNINPEDLKMTSIFDTQKLQEFNDKLWEQTQIYEKLKKEAEGKKGNMTSKQTKEWEKQKKIYEDTIAELKAQQKAISDIITATETYSKSQDDLKTKALELQKTEALYLKSLKIEAEYKRQSRAGDDNADADRNIANAKVQIALTEQQMITDESRYEQLKNLANKTKAQSEEELALKTKLFEHEKTLTEQQTIIEDNEYTKRTNRMNAFYAQIDKDVEIATQRSLNKKTKQGWGTADYNVNMDALTAQLNAVNTKMAELNNQADMDATERMNRMVELEQQAADLSLQIETEKVNRKIAINQTYYNALSQMASGVQSILQNEMSKYDENSEQYKKLAVANAWIDTLSGTLSAFMSGMQSGVPAPWNVALATALAGMTFYAGQQQIKAIESGTKSNAMSVNYPTTTYETVAYKNQSELLGKVGDQKVYVTESDITNTQRKVSVRESNARY